MNGMTHPWWWWLAYPAAEFAVLAAIGLACWLGVRLAARRG